MKPYTGFVSSRVRRCRVGGLQAEHMVQVVRAPGRTLALDLDAARATGQIPS